MFTIDAEGAHRCCKDARYFLSDEKVQEHVPLVAKL